MQVIKIGQTKPFVIMQGCIINLTVSHPFLPFRTLFYETPCIFPFLYIITVNVAPQCNIYMKLVVNH